MTRAAPPFDQIVFSGGGIRCFWHGGWMEAVGAAVDLGDIKRVSGVSGGALSGASWLAGRERKLLEVMGDAFRGEDANVDWNEVDGDDGLTLHQRVYQSVVDEVLNPDAQARIARGDTAFQVLLGRPGKTGPAVVRAVMAGLGYQVEKAVRSHPKSRLPELAGMTAELIDARAAAADGKLADLVRIAATIPPIFRISEWDGRPSIDGGMLNQAPMPDPDEGKTLILLTRLYDDLPPDTDRVVHVAPSSTVLEDRIDFTDPGKLDAAWDAGVLDGEIYLSTLK